MKRSFSSLFECNVLLLFWTRIVLVSSFKSDPSPLLAPHLSTLSSNKDHYRETESIELIPSEKQSSLPKSGLITHNTAEMTDPNYVSTTPLNDKRTEITDTIIDADGSINSDEIINNDANISSNNEILERSDTEEGESVPRLPAPSVDIDKSMVQKLSVGETLSLDHLGPIILNTDGTGM